MTVYCSGDCHVWLGASSLCTCEALRQALQPFDKPFNKFRTRLRMRRVQDATQDATHRVAMYGFPANYNPFSPPGSQTDVPLAQFHAAQAIKDATHLSSDGERVYSQRMGNVRVYYWDEETKSFGSSFPCVDGLPADAVVIERSNDE